MTKSSCHPNTLGTLKRNRFGVRSTESIKLWLWMQESRRPSPLGAWNVHKGLMWHKEANLTSRFSSKPRLITTASKSSARPPPPEFTLNWSSTEEMCPEPPQPPPKTALPVVPLRGGTEAHCGGSAHPVYTRRHALLTFQQVCFISLFFFSSGMEGVLCGGGGWGLKPICMQHVVEPPPQ